MKFKDAFEEHPNPTKKICIKQILRCMRKLLWDTRFVSVRVQGVIVETPSLYTARVSTTLISSNNITWFCKIKLSRVLREI